MSMWVRKGLRTGVKSSRYPKEAESAGGISPGFPRGGSRREEEARALIVRCPTGAIQPAAGGLFVDPRRCIHCFRCARPAPGALEWEAGFEWAWSERKGDDSEGHFGREFRRSLHVLVVDAGDCGACLREVKHLNNPYYAMHRLGFFITPTPRKADILLVVGSGTDPMRLALRKVYDAMPAPKKVVAAGACALSGGVFGPSFISSAGVSEILPVDVEIPGSPPPPLALLHGLLVAAGRRSPAPSGLGKDAPGKAATS